MSAAKKKCLLPVLDLQNLPNEKCEDSLEPKYQSGLSTWAWKSTKQKYFIYDVSKEGRPVTRVPNKPTLFLASVLAHSHKNMNPLPIISKICYKADAYTRERKKSFSATCYPCLQEIRTGDIIALQTYAAYLLIKEQMNNNHSSFRLIDNCLPLVNDYLSSSRQCNGLKIV